MKRTLKFLLLTSLLVNVVISGALANESYQKPSQEEWSSMSKDQKIQYRQERRQAIQAHKAKKKEERRKKKEERQSKRNSN